LFAEIQNAKLKKADPSTNEEKAAPPPMGLAGTLARAMDERRKVMKEEDQNADDEDDDWSDNDWDS
jgi:hypothetical protein